MVRIKRTPIDTGKRRPSIEICEEPITVKRKKCRATTARGKRCKRWEGKNTKSGMCFHHHTQANEDTSHDTTMEYDEFPIALDWPPFAGDSECIVHSWEGIDLNQRVEV